jgi:hypothetical protein
MFPSLKRIILIPIAAMTMVLPFHGCMTGSEIPNELSGSFVDRNGTAEAGTKVSLYRSDRIPGQGPDSLPVAFTQTDAKGGFRFQAMARGTYSLLAEKSGARAFQDSVIYTGTSYDVGADTLKAPGALVGRILLVRPDDPRKALVQVLGTNIYVNVDSSGIFNLTDMAEGRYRIRILIDSANYVPQYRVVSIRSGMTDTLQEVIEPFYQGPPRLSDIKAEAFPDGTIRVTWNKAKSGIAFTYAVFREAMGYKAYSGSALQYFLTDTVFIDTVYSKTPRKGQIFPDPASEVYDGQYPYEDTTAYPFRYRVMTFPSSSNDGSDQIMVNVVAIPPTTVKDTTKTLP